MTKAHIFQFCVTIFCIVILSAFWNNQQRPVLYIIGDSTVKNADGYGKNPQWGWGSIIQNYFDTTKIAVRNHAIGGRSSRTFLTDGRWEKILANLKPGDYVMMQFGHNDGAPLDDTARARGTIRGISDESREIYNPIRKVQEVVYTYGWYMRKYIDEAKAKGAIPIVCSLVPRDRWKDGKVQRSENDYALWAKQVAASNGAFFVNLNTIIADQYDTLGQEQVTPLFVGDHTHTSLAGATLNAASVAQGVASLHDCDLKNFLRK